MCECWILSILSHVAFDYKPITKVWTKGWWIILHSHKVTQGKKFIPVMCVKIELLLFVLLIGCLQSCFRGNCHNRCIPRGMTRRIVDQKLMSFCSTQQHDVHRVLSFSNWKTVTHSSEVEGQCVTYSPGSGVTELILSTVNVTPWMCQTTNVSRPRCSHISV